MIKFFRKIRQQLITQNKFSKYLLYAIGEIILVVIGILIALQLNNYNDYKKERIEEARILSSLTKDLSNDVDQLDEIMEREKFVIERIDSMISLLNSPDQNRLTEFLKLSRAIISFRSFVTNNGTFEESISAGKMDYVLNDTLREDIFDYYKVARANLGDDAISKYQHEIITPMFTEIIFQSNEGLTSFTNKKNKLIPLEISDLSTNSKFNQIIGWRYMNANIQIQIWMIYKKNAHDLLNHIESELIN